ncbi:MAG: ABC transporter permease [Clostridiaceae bacterium]|jgi:ABC-2 type transport system permease protein|nr:ABC transporter permease [Clostridiaceae bacterium]
MSAIFWKEVKSYFYSPMAYILIGLFMLLTSIFFIPNLMYQVGSFNNVLSNMGFILLFIVPVLTMRILAEDRKNGTEVLLITSPASITSMVVGKYLAVCFVFLVLTLLSLIYPIVLLAFGATFTAGLVGGYIGFILLGMTFISVGVFCSSLTESQVVAVIVSYVMLLIMWLAGSLGGMLGGFAAKVLGWFSLLTRYEDFTRGILGLSPVVYYLSFITVFLFITIRVIEKRRWSQG